MFHVEHFSLPSPFSLSFAKSESMAGRIVPRGTIWVGSEAKLGRNVPRGTFSGACHSASSPLGLYFGPGVGGGMMESPNAFAGHATLPTMEEVETALGPSAPLWHEFVEWVHQHGAAGEEWKCTSLKHGWSLRLQQKKRNIVYLSECAGCIRVAFLLSDRAIEAARTARLPKRVLEELERAPRYPEGLGCGLWCVSTAIWRRLRPWRRSRWRIEAVGEDEDALIGAG